MKRVFKLLTVFSLVALVACNEAKRENDSNNAYDNDDSKEQAEEANDEKFDDNKIQNDAEFVTDVVAANYAEVRLAELGNQRSSHPRIKEMATMLAKDHSKVLDELKKFSQTKGYSIPTGPTEDATDKIQKFGEKKAEDFNKDWTKEMIDKHEESIKKFEKRMDKTEDADLRAWISKTLPTLRNHLQQLEAIREQLKNTNS